MNRSIIMLFIGLFFGGGFGFLIAASSGAAIAPGHDHATDHGSDEVADHEPAADADAHHSSAPLELSGDPAVPGIEIRLTPDSASGWNLNLLTTDFRFAPENAGGGHVAGEGHAHVYVNGRKIARLYGPWMHIPAAPESGEFNVTVTLNSNDHSVFSLNGEVISATATASGS